MGNNIVPWAWGIWDLTIKINQTFGHDPLPVQWVLYYYGPSGKAVSIRSFDLDG